MTDPPLEKLVLGDLTKVINTVADSLSEPSDVRSIAKLSDIRRAAIPDGGMPTALWTPVFEAALQAKAETLPKLLFNVRENLGQEPRDAVDKALQEVRRDCISRFTLDTHPEVGDRADALLVASGPEEMIEPAKKLREMAISVRRLLLRPLLADTFLQLQRELDISFPDPLSLRIQLADQAVDVVTAVDYLLTLLLTEPHSGQLILGGEPGSERMQGRTDEESLDWLRRRRLDARGTAVRQGQRLLTALRRHIVTDLCGKRRSRMLLKLSNMCSIICVCQH
jgi:hypothetical protein